MVNELGIVDRELEQSELGRQGDREQDRLQLLTRHVNTGRLLDVGASTGDFLSAAAGAGFVVSGIEPDPGTSATARAAGLDVSTGSLDSVGPPAGGYDVVTMFHVIEHLDSPRAALSRVRELLAPGGIVLIETPRVDCAWFTLAPARWRQLIPDHYWFFSPATLGALMQQTGFELLEHRQASREVTLRLLVDRLRRAGVPGADLLRRVVTGSGFAQRRVRVNPGDIMQIVGRAG
jgi:SAM-dependent methyltransferase